MRKRIALAAVAAVCLLATACKPLHLTTPAGAAPVRYRDKVFTEVDLTKDLVYGQAADLSGTMQTLRLDLYQPKGDDIAKRPAIVWVHGGGFKNGDKESPELVDESNNFAKFGYVNVSIDYRMGSGCLPYTSQCIDGIKMAYHDAQAAVRWLRANAATYRIDPDRIAVGGSSAGAITAYNVAYANANDVGHSGNPGYSSKVAAAVSISGASLTTTPDPGEPPTLDFHGTADGAVPLSWQTTTHDAAAKAHLIAEQTIWEGAGHVPYAQHHDEIIDQTRNFLYAAMDLSKAAH